VSYAKGQGIAQNDAEAVKWFRKSAEQGNKVAEEELEALDTALPPPRTKPRFGRIDRGERSEPQRVVSGYDGSVGVRKLTLTYGWTITSL